MADDHKYHIDHHGSLVRPAGLLAVRASGDAGALAAAETEAAASVSHALRRLTLSAVGDGQFRREHFESVVYDHVDGFGPVSGTQPLADAAGIPAARRRTAPDDAQPTGRLAEAEVAPVLATVDRPVFVQLPSPGYLAAVGSALAGSAGVDAARARGTALAAVLRAEIQALAAAGVAYVALANPLYPPLLTVAGRERLTAVGLDVDAVLTALLEADRAVMAGLTAPDTFRLGLDLADAGPLPTTERGYDPAAVDTLLDENPFHRLCVDFPADPAARLPLERVKPGLVLSLGVVDVSVPAAEAVEDLLVRLDPVIDERTEEDVAIATNGGFAQSAASPLMTEDAQHAKLRLVETVRHPRRRARRPAGDRAVPRTAARPGAQGRGPRRSVLTRPVPAHSRHALGLREHLRGSAARRPRRRLGGAPSACVSHQSSRGKPRRCRAGRAGHRPGRSARRARRPSRRPGRRSTWPPWPAAPPSAGILPCPPASRCSR